MTIPEHIREEAKSIALDVFANAVDSDDDSHSLDTVVAAEIIATAFLAAEQRGMERAAEIAASPVAVLNLPDEPLYEGDVRYLERRVALGITEAIRKVREERG